jgi:hypothetical protein
MSLRMSSRVLLAAGLSLAFVMAASAARATADRAEFRVTSTLAGKRVLPQRIHWRARVGSGVGVARVDFLIDGKLGWVEHHPPYDYGEDGNWLVTTWLKPGMHRFTVRAVTSGGRSATQTTTARVLPAPEPPADLAGTWSRNVTEGDAGTWHVTINRIGWLFDDPHGGGQNQDVSYPASGKVLIRAAIEEPPFGRYARGGAFCDHEPDPPGLYDYTVSSDSRTLTLEAASSDCRESLLQGTWTRVG